MKCTREITIKNYDEIVANDLELNFVCNSSLSNLPFSDNFATPETTPETPNIDMNDTAQFECFQRKGLHFIHINARSMLPKMSELRWLATKIKPAVLTVSETWLDESVTRSEIMIEGYSCERNDRDRTGGGVCMYISNNIAYNPTDDLKCDKLEAVWVDLRLPKHGQ